MQRLAETTPTDDQRERLKRIARRVDTWSETRTNKTLYESWMGLYVADWLEDKYPERNNKPTASSSVPQLQEREPGEKDRPRFFSISVVDRT